MSAMCFGFSDPPYLGMGRLHKEHPKAAIWNRADTYESHIAMLSVTYPDGWALCASSNYQAGDTVVDLFPGTGIMTTVLGSIELP